MMNDSIGTTILLPSQDTWIKLTDDKHDYIIAIKAGLYSFVFIIGIFGNVLVVKATKQNMSLKGATNILICNLCLCDIVLLLLGIPAYVVSENTDRTTACKILNFLTMATITATVYTLVAIAVERCNVIVNSRRFKVILTSRHTYYIISTIDLLAIISSAPLVFIEYNAGNVHCLKAGNENDNLMYTAILIIFQYVFPLIVMVTLYAMCWQKIRRKNKATIKMANNNRRRFHTSRACRSQSDGDISVASGSGAELENEKEVGVLEPRPVSGEFLNKEVHDFMSGSQNHLSGIKRHSWQRTAIIRRSFSLDSVLADSSNDVSDNRKRSSFCRRSTTCDARLSFTSANEGNGTNGEIMTTEKSKSSRRSFVGSVQRIHASFTSLIIGADGHDALTMFAMKRVKQTLKTLRMFSFLMLVFALCFLPHHVTIFVVEDVPDTFSFMELFIYINAALNPWIYAGMNKSYRVAFAGFFRRQQQRRSHYNHNGRLRWRRQPVHVINNWYQDQENSKRNKIGNDSTPYRKTVRSFSKFIDWLCFNSSPSKGQYNSEQCCEDPSSNDMETLDTIGNLFETPTRKRSATGRRTNSVLCTHRIDCKISRKSSTISSQFSSHKEQGHIPTLAPIIIITNYDEELALQQALNEEREALVQRENEDKSGAYDGEEDRFSVILSFNDEAWD